MKKVYKYQKGKEVRYFSNLSKLCKALDLNYTNVYYSIKRLGKDTWSNDDCKVFVLVLE